MLTPKRLFDAEPLLPPLPQQAQFVPDSADVVYLQTAPHNREELQLWRFRSDTGRAECWLTADALGASDASETEAERAERERRRQFAAGITSFEFSDDGTRLLVPFAGRGFVFEVADELGTPLYGSPATTRQSELTLSPTGRWLSFVRAGDLYVTNLVSGEETRLTHDGGDTVTNGAPDFIAQEEMHRFTGHWWSPDERCIAFQRTDESPVAISHRHDINADEIRVIDQRYPYAGASNAAVSLHLATPGDAAVRPLPAATPEDGYLARVVWGGDVLYVQVQTRDQQQLQTKRLEIGSEASSWQLIDEEHSATWINLQDDLQGWNDGLLLCSERGGSNRLYVCAATPEGGWQTEALTPAAHRITRVVRADAERGDIYYCAWEENPTQQHLYRRAADGNVTALTRSEGWHDGLVNQAGTWRLDQWSNLTTPPTLDVVRLDDGERHRIAGGPVTAAHGYHAYAALHRPSALGTLNANDGQTLHYRLTLPADTTTPVPAIVYVYGGPGVQRVRNDWPPLMLQLFAQRGFAVLELDNRGSGNRTPAFEAPIYRRLGNVEVQDQLLGVDFLRGLDAIDAQRIGVFGHSYGGYMTLMCLAQAPDAFKAGTSVAPVADWHLYDTHYTERYLGTPQDNPRGYADSGVLPHLDKLRGGLLLIHGMADDNVLFANCTALMHRLQELGTPFELMTYPGSKHALQEPHVSIHRFELMLDFFERVL